jgi:hypothetical protein
MAIVAGVLPAWAQDVLPWPDNPSSASRSLSSANFCHSRLIGFFLESSQSRRQITIVAAARSKKVHWPSRSEMNTTVWKE